MNSWVLTLHGSFVTIRSEAFFVRWWRQQDEKTRALVKELVKDGRRAVATREWGNLPWEHRMAKIGNIRSMMSMFVCVWIHVDLLILYLDSRRRGGPEDFMGLVWVNDGEWWLMTNIWGFPYIRIPQNGWFRMDNPIQNGWNRGYPYFREPPYGYGNIMSMMSMFVIVFSRMYRSISMYSPDLQTWQAGNSTIKSSILCPATRDRPAGHLWLPATWVCECDWMCLRYGRLLLNCCWIAAESWHSHWPWLVDQGLPFF